MEIKSEVRGSHSGQLDQTLYIEQGGDIIAYLDFSEFDGEPHVQMIHVAPEHRRNGLGVALLRNLQKRFPDTEIDLGSLTDEGAHLINSLSFVTVTDEKLDKQFRFLQRIRDQLQILSELPPEEQRNRGTEWNRLHDMESRLEDELWNKSPTKQLIESRRDISMRYLINAVSKG